jgi:hypothetical protein
MNTKNVLILGFIVFGAYYFYDKNKKKTTETQPNKEEEKETTANDGITSGGGVLPNAINLTPEKEIGSGVGVIGVTVKPKKEPIAEEPIMKGLSSISKNLTSKDVLKNLEMYNVKTNSKLPTTSMGGDNKFKTTTVSMKSVKTDIPIKTMSNFYDFDADNIDNEQFLID